MTYPVDVERELDKAEDKLCSVRISGEKWAYFRMLVEEINRAYEAGTKQTGGYPLLVGANLSADSDRLGGFGVIERKLVLFWMEEANRAYSVGSKQRTERPAMGGISLVDLSTGRRVSGVKAASDLEYYLSKFIRAGTAFCIEVPDADKRALVQPVAG